MDLFLNVCDLGLLLVIIISQVIAMGCIEYEIVQKIMYKAANESPEGKLGLYSSISTDYLKKHDSLGDYTPLKMYKKRDYDSDK